MEKEKNSLIKIFVVCHKKEKLNFKEDMYPIFVGGINNELSNKKENYCDNIGDNISIKNKTYNEMTAIYWLWKHYQEIGNPDYIGVEQYRRFFYPTGNKNYYEMDEGKKDCFFNMNRDDSCLVSLLETNDFIAPFPMKCKSVYSYFKSSHGEEAIKKVLDIIENLYPKDIEIAKEYLFSNRCYLYNMFILKRQDFLDYCSWIFPILDEYEKVAIPNERFFISERLTGIFFYKLLKEGRTVKHIPIVLFNEKKSLKKDNSGSKRKSFKSKVVPLIRFFTPKKLWVAYKRTRFYKK